MKKVGIIGAGIAGLSVAIRSAIDGNDVHVYESNDYPGGKLSEIRLGNYRFDAGPSLFTLPELVDDLFKLAGEKPSDHFQYDRLEKLCRYFYEDGLQLTAFADPQAFGKEITDKLHIPSDRLLKGLAKSAQLYDLLADLFMYKSIHRASTFLSKKALCAYPNMHKLNFLKTMHEANIALYKHPALVQLFDRYATYNGSDPYQTPATMNIIPHLEYHLGAYAPKGGMISITQSLFELAQRKGVHFHFKQKVTQIIVQQKKAIGIVSNDERHFFDQVISNMDVVNTYQKLLPQIPAPERLLKQPKSSSALIFYWGINRSFEELDVHNIFFSKNYKEEFNHIFHQKKTYADPTIYVNISSKYTPGDAPIGSENWFTMINVPHNEGQDWNQLIYEARNNIIDKLSRLLQTDIRPHIVEEDYLDPRRIEARTSSFGGALYGNSSNNKFSAFLRHANYSSKIKNLYFCGGSVHPGGGIPLSILSGKLAHEFMSE
ncbi:1-hydroxycarotenoid 3,4-desaturase CrtD [Persicobacter psychrovividus]|uniref:Phytoene desaturase n=1 Tax=Persicobacter psychrovividus TaxID=387638 RepID=A0ABM7VB02_9BACT|nr:phytoene desaturase [Persicobacter psychrovividus]